MSVGDSPFDSDTLFLFPSLECNQGHVFIIKNEKSCITGDLPALRANFIISSFIK